MSEKQYIIPFPPFFLLFVLFLGLKLAGKIAWSWWWVTAPLWGPFIFMIVLMLTLTTILIFKK